MYKKKTKNKRFNNLILFNKLKNKVVKYLIGIGANPETVSQVLNLNIIKFIESFSTIL